MTENKEKLIQMSADSLQKYVKEESIKYAQLKVKEALELAAEKAQLLDNGEIGNEFQYIGVDKQSITNVFNALKFD